MKLRFEICFYFLLLQFAKVSNEEIDVDLILPIMEYFNVLHPIVIDKTNTTFQEKWVFLKMFSHRGQSISYNLRPHTLKQSYVLIIKDLNDFAWKIQTESAILVVTRFTNWESLKKLEIDIGNEMYFVHLDTLEVFEAYNVNNKQFVNYLGRSKDVSGPRMFIPANDFIPSFVERRGNFQGIELKSMVDFEPPMVSFPKNFRNITKYFPNNQTYDLSDVTTGYFIDILRNLEKTYNFSTRLYRRQDGSWGTPTIYPNGSYTIPGMIRNLHEGSADFAFVPYGLKLERMAFADFLPVLDRAYVGIFLPDLGSFETFHWTLFSEIFVSQVWILIVASSAILAISLFCMGRLFLSKKPVIYIYFF